MDWFEKITGFREDGYESTRSKLSVVDGHLHSTRSDRTCAVGRLETPTLAELRQRTAGMTTGMGPTRVSCVRGDVREMHRDAGNAGALFQVASQFNLLEMTSPSVSPEDGVTRYADDGTQGPACAIAAGGGTIYRNYFAPVDGHVGQTKGRQINCLRDIGARLGNDDGSLWTMRNGYCMTTEAGLAAIDERLGSLDADAMDELMGCLRIGLQWNVEVTDHDAGHRVSQAYCSALPVSYNQVRRPSSWERFTCLVLNAAYEATLLSAVLNRQAGGPPVVYLTRLGGGVFGNEPAWIVKAVRRALMVCRDIGLDVRIVSSNAPSIDMQKLANEFNSFGNL